MSSSVAVDRPGEATFHGALFSAVRDAVVYATFPEREVLDVNEAFLSLFGLSREEAVGASMEVVHVDRDHFARFGALVRDRLLRGESVTVEWPFRRADASTFVGQATLTPAGRLANGRMALLGIIRDLTEEKRLVQLYAEAEARWRSLVENAPDWLFVADEDGRVRFMNRGRDGVPAASIVGRTLYEWLAPAEADRVRPAYESVFRTAKPAAFEMSAAIDGHARSFECRVSPVLQDGRVVAATVITTDVTERRRDEAEIAQMRAHLIEGEKLAALGSLVSGVAHEVRTPLTFLGNNAFLAQQRIRRAAERGASAQDALDESTKFFAEMRSAIDRINQLVEDLRRYTRARRDAQLTIAPLHQMITDVVELFRATSRGRFQLETSLSPTPFVRGNKGALQQLVLNLLQNAADASPPGAIIRVATRARDEQSVLEVTDHGNGIPRDVLDRMYEPLFTTKPEGTGLGLSIVKRIVDEHGARIECETEPGKGTTFRVAFPQAPSG